MKFDPTQWSVIKEGTEYETQSELLRVMCNAKIAVYVIAEGVEALAAFRLEGGEVTLRVKAPFRYRIETVNGAKVYAFAPIKVRHASEGEVYTNIDRKPQQSGALLEVTKALRAFKLEAQAIRKSLTPKKPEAEEPVIEEPEPVVEEAPETSAKEETTVQA